MTLDEMHDRVNNVIGESKSRTELFESLPDLDFSQFLRTCHGYHCFESFIPTLRNIQELSTGPNWVRWVNLDELDTELIKLCGFKSRLSWISLALGINVKSQLF
jgi:hypothetical protein